MKVLVFGAGVQGTVFAVRLARAGHHVTLVARGERATFLREHGAVIDDAVSNNRIACKLSVIEHVAPDVQADVCFVTVRREQLDDAVQALAAAPGLRRVVVACEWAILSLLFLLVVMSILELSLAWNVQPCSVKPITPNCYPWGWTEGPIPQSWSYASKRNYLISSLYMLVFAAGGLSSILWLPPGRRISALLATIAMLYDGEHLLERVV